MENNQINFDIAIIGGGPAGIIAAIKASENGAKVVLVEKNEILGKKLLITGNGRSNITQKEFNNRNFTKKLGKNGDFLLSGLSIFNSRDTINFFEKLGLKTKTERGNRVFPLSNKSTDLVKVLFNKLKNNNVHLFLKQEVKKINIKNQKIESIETQDIKIKAKSFILATGGKSMPLTGSNGTAYQLVKKIGHKVSDLRPGLVSIKIKEDWIKDLEGLSLRNINLLVFQDNQKKDSRFGEMIFTRFGISGPIVLDLSKKIGELLIKGSVFLKIDLKPALEFHILDKRLERDFKGSKIFKNYLPEIIPKKLKKLIIEKTKIDPNKKIGLINKEERKKIINTLKNIDLTVKELAGFNFAIITIGGISLLEINNKKMQSKKIENLFFAGEIIDLDGPTGGYNLQICWTTGYLAGMAADKYLEN